MNFFKRLFTKKTALKFGTPPVMGFWETLRDKKPFFVLAPMADVTDCVFRELIAKYSRANDNPEPSVFWTEFVSADGLCSEGREALLVDLRYGEAERPIVAQLFGSNVENMKKASKLVAGLGFDGIDINMGCPDRSIEKQGAGASMIKNPIRAREIIRAVKEGAPNLPVSVKTRVGYNSPNLESWISELLREGIAALTIHARTRKEMSKVPARWEFVKEAVAIRDKMKVPTLIIGNGDINSLEEGQKRFEETGCNGIMVGRGIFGRPWFFANFADKDCHCEIEHPSQKLPNFDSQNEDIKFNQLDKATQSRNSAERSECVASNLICNFCGGSRLSIRNRLLIAIEHSELFEKNLVGKFKGGKNFNIMKKHFKAYASGFDGAKELRMEIMETAQNASDIRRIIENFLNSR